MTLKEISERRAKLTKLMQEIVEKSRIEKRATTAEEKAQFDEYDKEFKALEDTEAMEKRAQELALAESEEQPASDTKTEKRAQSVQKYSAVNAFIRGGEVRADTDGMTTSENGVIATDYSNDIIKKVQELSGIINRIGIVNSRGDYKQIVADGANKITAGWTSELAEVTSSEAKFTTITIGHYKLGSLFKVSNELINQNYFDIASEGVNQMSEDFALKAETAIIAGTGTDQPTGLITSGTAYELASGTAITADELITIQHALKAPYQMNAVWIMSNDTLCKLRLLKDGAGQYIFHLSDMTSGFAGTVLGKPVLVSEAMDNIGAGKKPILYGDFSRAYKANINPDVSLQVLREKYATQGAVGVLGFMHLDGKPVNAEAYVTVSCPAADTDTSADTGTDTSADDTSGGTD